MRSVQRSTAVAGSFKIEYNFGTKALPRPGRYSYTAKSYFSKLMLSAVAFALLAATAPGTRAETVAGTTDGALSVDASGAANYAIPISVPPGVAGMQPDLSLIYSSRGDNGILGVGWSLGGLSIIQRCPRTIAQDGVAGGVEFDTDDRFCLDGQRLIAISGADGAAGTEYRTEVDGFSRIVSHGAAGSGPEYFTVETKSGQILEYGVTADSRVLLTGRPEVRFWALNRVEDTVGNYMTFHYLEDAANETCRLDRIAYAGNTTAGTLPQSEVRFAYELRPDQRSFYQGGARINMTHRLTGVETFTNAELVRDYRFGYDESPINGRSRLLSVTECSGSDCLAPTSFKWDAGDSGWLLESRVTGIITPSTVEGYIPENMQQLVDEYSIAYDINGDGLTDLFHHTEGNESGNRASINIGDGWQNDPTYVPPYPYVGNDFRGKADSQQFGASQFIDLNGDGLIDQVYHRKRINGVVDQSAYLSNGTEWLPEPDYISPVILKIDRQHEQQAVFAELNGDGLPDLVFHRVLQDGNIDKGAYLNTGAGWQSVPEFAPPHRISQHDKSDRGVRFLDVNGDGLDDQVFHLDGIDQGAYLNTGNGWISAPAFTPPHAITLDTRAEIGVRFIDVNGDGLVDQIFHRKGIDQGAFLNTGAGWQSAPEYAPPYAISDDALQGLSTIGTGSRFIDVNGDGLVDQLYHQNKLNTSVTEGVKGAYTNTGSGWQSAPEYTPPFYIAKANNSSWIMARFLDFNGDGLDDFLHFYRKSLLILNNDEAGAYSNAARRDLLVEVLDSLGRETIITYKPLTDNGVYNKGTGAVFPEQDFIGPLYVVQEVSSDDGIGGQARTSYSYEGARTHVQGRGFLGFARMTAVDETTGIETVTDYRQDFPFIGQVAATEQRLADGTLISRVADTWAETPLNGGLTTFPFVAQSQAETFEINDGPGNLPVTTITTTNVYDDFGNPTSIVATTAGGAETFTKTTTNLYVNDEVNWFLGRLTRATVKSELPDLSFETRVSAFDYDPLTGLLEREVIEPDLPAFRLTTDYTRDAFGNIETKTVSGDGVTARRTTTEFSADGRFAVRVINDLGHDEIHAHDARFGTVTSLTGPNLITTTWAFDGFGRRTLEAREDGTETRTSYELCTTQCPAGGVYAVSQQDFITASGTPIGPRSVEYFDALNRAFRSETEGFDGTRIFVDTEFNARGEAVAVTRPYFEGTAPADIQRIVTTYDDIGRPTSVTQPDGGVTTSDYAGLTTSSTNALNQTATRRTNAIGELVEATDNLGTVITYSYDPFGNLEETDAGGVVTTMVHDIRGRKTSMNDPNMGQWFYVHNVFGEVISQTDAEDQTVTFDYDTLGRVIRRVEAEGPTDWVYDTAAKGIGKLHSISAPDGYLRTQNYDSLGRPGATTTTIEGGQLHLERDLRRRRPGRDPGLSLRLRGAQHLQRPRLPGLGRRGRRRHGLLAGRRRQRRGPGDPGDPGQRRGHRPGLRPRDRADRQDHDDLGRHDGPGPGLQLRQDRQPEAARRPAPGPAGGLPLRRSQPAARHHPGRQRRGRRDPGDQRHHLRCPRQHRDQVGRRDLHLRRRGRRAARGDRGRRRALRL